MATITVERQDLSAEEVAAALRHVLGGGYLVRRGEHGSANPFAGPVPARADTIFVGEGEERLRWAQVDVVHRGGHTELQIRPGGMVSLRLLNALGVARRVRNALRDAPELARPPQP
jgi:hypothetical protein